MPKAYIKLPPLEVEPELGRALNNYCRQIGVPRARVIRQVLRDFLGPLVSIAAASDSQGGALDLPGDTNE